MSRPLERTAAPARSATTCPQNLNLAVPALAIIIIMTIKQTLEQSIAENWTQNGRNGRVYTVADVVDAMELGIFTELSEAPKRAPAVIAETHHCLMSELVAGDEVVTRSGGKTTITHLKRLDDGRTDFRVEGVTRARTWRLDNVWVRKVG